MKYIDEDSKYHEIRTEFHVDWFRHSEVEREDTKANRHQGDLISLLL
jgi:hypothetical protein